MVDCSLKVVKGKHRIDFSHLEKELSKSETSLLLFCNPHNPGGRSWDMEELERLVQMCIKYDVKIFCDEIHSDIIYPPNEHISLLKIEGADKICLIAHSIGKTFNTSGLKASFAVIPDAELRERFVETARRNHSQAVNLLGMLAIETLFSKKGAKYKKELIAYLQKSIFPVVEKLESVDGLSVMEPEATFLLWCDFRRFGSWSHVMERLVNEAGVALSGGTFFGPSGEGWFRINCAHPRSQLLGATERIVQTFSR